MKKGFTLIELLIVIAIIAILAAILFVSIGQAPLVKSRDVKRAQDLDSIRTALTLYYSTNNAYPASVAALVTAGNLAAEPVDPRGVNPVVASNIAGCAGLTPNVPSGIAFAAGNFGYRYTPDATNQNYVLQACLEETNSNLLRNDCQNGSATPPCSAPSGATLQVYDLHS